MKAIGYQKALPILNPDSLIDIVIPEPVATGRDLLIRIKAIAVNPVDCKIRQNVSPSGNNHKVIGWDAVGEVIGVGELVEQFEIGDQVFYAGDLNRQGCNAEFQVVDERIVGNKPTSISNAEAAALPLTSITAWEMMFEHLALEQHEPDSDVKSNEVVLIVGAAGGVGSILIQLIKKLTGATVIGTASRKSSKSWVKQLGADYVVDHSEPLGPQIEALQVGRLTHIASLTHTDSYMDSYVDLLAPFGKIALIDDPKSLDVSKVKRKSLSVHWEFMFARSMYNAVDIDEQGQLLNRVAELVDQGHVRTTAGKNLGKINATNLKTAHEEIESGRSIGKIVLEGF